MQKYDIEILRKGSGNKFFTVSMAIILIAIALPPVSYISTPGIRYKTPNIYLTNESGALKVDFQPGDFVYIHGINFVKYNKVKLNITNPYGSVNSCNVMTDANGTFNYNYKLYCDLGVYTVNANDSENFSSITFRSIGIYFDNTYPAYGYKPNNHLKCDIDFTINAYVTPNHPCNTDIESIFWRYNYQNLSYPQATTPGAIDGQTLGYDEYEIKNYVWFCVNSSDAIISFSDEGEYGLYYWAKDNINQKSKIINKNYYVDDSSPDFTFEIGKPYYIQNENKQYITNETFIWINATDLPEKYWSSGIESIYWRYQNNIGLHPVYNESGAVEGSEITANNGYINENISKFWWYIENNDKKVIRFENNGIYELYYWANDNVSNPTQIYKERFYVVGVIPSNNPPNIPMTDLEDGATGINIDADLRWTCSDPEEDILTFEVYFGTTNNPPLVSSNQLESIYDPGPLNFKTTYFWRVIAKDNHNATSSSSLWSFTTKSSGGGDGGSTTPAPVAEAGGPYFELLVDGFANVNFDGSASIGSISTYSWDFGDGVKETGKSPTHSYSSLGNYTVNLIVSGPGGSDYDSTYVAISEIPNNPPTMPILTGPTTATKEINYEYTAVSTDIDNDNITYNFYFSDAVIPIVIFDQSNSNAVKVNHTWSTYGVFFLKVNATDSKAFSATSTITILIDVIWAKDKGYLIDSNADGTYDKFFSNETLGESLVEKQTDDSYLINSDNDIEWDFSYNAKTDTIDIYSQSSKNEKIGDNLMLLAFAILIIMMVIIVILVTRKNKSKRGKTKKITRF